MEELLKAIQDETGLPTEQARGAAEAAMEFSKEKLPGELGDKLEDIIAGKTDGIADAVGGLADQAKGFFNR